MKSLSVLQNSSALSGIAPKYVLTYNPNVSVDGVGGAINPHGLVVGKDGMNLLNSKQIF